MFKEKNEENGRKWGREEEIWGYIEEYCSRVDFLNGRREWKLKMAPGKGKKGRCKKRNI